MDFSYVAYTQDNRLVKGKLSASSEEAATNLLSYGGYRVLSVKPHAPFFSLGKVSVTLSRIKPTEVIMFSRQLALLIASGTDIVTSLELLEAQVTNRTFKKVISAIAADIRGGSSLSSAMSKHPKAFSQIYHRAIAAGEQGGNLEIVLRQMADFIERSVTTQKKIKSALAYPIIVAVVAIAVVVLLVVFILPAFTTLYTAFGTELPLATSILITITSWLTEYGLFLLLGIITAVAVGYIYTRIPTGKYQWHKLSLRLPVVGRILLLTELARACRTMALLFRVGLPLPEIMALATHGTSNKAMAEALTGVQHELIRGEGLSRPMGRRPLFLPLMVQMASVGEETGNLDATLSTVATSYEVEADDRTTTAVGLIQPIMTVGVGLVIAFIAISLVSAMYSLYGQI